MISRNEGKPPVPAGAAPPTTVNLDASRTRAVGQAIIRNWFLYVLLLPSFLFTFVFYYYPVVSGLFHSFTYWDLKNTEWVGWENYQRFFSDSATGDAWRNMAIILVANIIIVLTTPLLIAALIAHLPAGRNQFFWRLTFVLPLIVPATVTIFVWRWIFGQDGGLNQLLSLIGLEQLRHLWLGDTTTAIWAIIFTGFPWAGGLNFLLYLAALLTVPRELLDAARIDGAGAFRRFLQVELPLIRRQVLLIVTLTFIYYLRSFDAPLIMTNGGPGTTGTLVPGLQMFRAVHDDLDLGYGSAIGVVLLIVTLVIGVIRRREENRG
jgi:raffinose/stachyose/melibiose transport system permease protein